MTNSTILSKELKPTIRPVKLEIEGFLSFKEKTTIEFAGSSILLIGKRTDSPVTSGTGKSSIVQAIAFALGFCDLPATELKNWDSKKMSVSLTLSDGNNEYLISRSPKLSLVINGQPYVSQSTAAEEKLAELLKTAAPIVEALTYRSQRTFGRFVHSDDQQKKEFLSSVLGLSDLENACEKAEKDKLVVDSELNSLQSTLTAVLLMIDNQDYSAEVERATAQYNKAKQDYDIALQSSKVPETLVLEINQLKQTVSELKQKQQYIFGYKHELSMLNNKLASLAGEIQILEGQECFTCHQHWAKSQSEIDRKRNEGMALMDRKNNLQRVIPELDQEILKLPEYEQKLSEKTAEMTTFGQNLSKFEQVANLAAQSLRLITEKKNNQLSILGRRDDLLHKIQESERKASKLKHIAAIFSKSGFMSVIFNEVLNEIELKVNDLMTAFENVNHLYLKFDSNTVSKNGNTKKRISINLYRQGNLVSFKSLSGGQKCAIELCVDLAIADVVKRRTGSPLGWIVLDEAMDGLDVESKRAAIDTLKPKINGLMIIIDHATEIKESFDNVIEVVYDGKCSHVKA